LELVALLELVVVAPNQEVTVEQVILVHCYTPMVVVAVKRLLAPVKEAAAAAVLEVLAATRD
jgi:hypothetical protein